MRIGTLVKMKRGDLGLGVVTEVREAMYGVDVTYLVQWVVVNMKRWQQDFELEVICE